MRKSKAVILNAVVLTGGLAGFSVAVWAESLVPHKGNNPAAICVKQVGVTAYPAQKLGCFLQPRAGGCHCDDWDFPTPGPAPTSTSSGGGGWSDSVINKLFSDHLKDQKKAAVGIEKDEFKQDAKEFKANLKAGRDKAGD